MRPSGAAAPVPAAQTERHPFGVTKPPRSRRRKGDISLEFSAIITVVGPDRVGIIADVCTLLAELRISVDEISQTIMGEMFTMIMRVHAISGAPAFDTIRDRLSEKSRESGLSIRIQREDIFNAMHTI